MGSPASRHYSPSRPLSTRAHRQLIGYLGLFLPFLLYLLAGIRATPGLTPWKLLDSVSAYYYTGATAIFTGVLFALALFLFTYQGYEGEKADRVIGRISGVAAAGVAIFPTTAPIDKLKIDWWSEATTTLHYTSAILLFICFILFAIWLFRKSSIKSHAARPRDKRTRDNICLACGVIMIGAVLWALSAMLPEVNKPIFWPEALAIGAFAVSWLVKGEAPQSIRNAVMHGVARLKQSPP